MNDMPECLKRRYEALDELIDELSSTIATQSDSDRPSTVSSVSNDASIKLLCEFWNILKQDPDYNLPEEVRERMGLEQYTAHCFKPQRLTCYMAEEQNDNNSTPSKQGSKASAPKSNESCHSRKCKPNAGATVKLKDSCSSKSKSINYATPLSRVLCNLKEAASFREKCDEKIVELINTQNLLKEQIQELETREKEGSKLLKQAECMWACMENAYKKKIKDSLERQKVLLKEMKDVEVSKKKWRKNYKDLEFQLANVNKCHAEINERYHQKSNDVNCIKIEKDNYAKRIENNKKHIAAAKKSFDYKKKVSDAKIKKLTEKIFEQRKVNQEEQTYKKSKEEEGQNYIKEARNDLQRIYRLMLEKKLENEDLYAEKDALQKELDLLKQTCEQCSDKCKAHEQSIKDEIAKVNAELSTFEARCTKCNKHIDADDIRKLCTDCPRCAKERECLIKGDHCTFDVCFDCVCMSTKQKFMGNVLDNIYSLLEKRSKTPVGKRVADAVLDCLQRSRNGKLNVETRKILQSFVLKTVKKNLNLTIIGGAVKTRCEMDADTYKKLMECLNLVKTTTVTGVVSASKDDKGTLPKKDPCGRWGGSTECNCPSGPKDCVCKKALPEPKDAGTCPDKDAEDGEVTLCPHKESKPCGAECAMHTSAVGKEVESWRQDPCNKDKCSFAKSTRAAQCVLGPESLISDSRGMKTQMPNIPDVSVLEDQIVCKCGSTPTKPCTCRAAIKSNSRERIIEEVLGRYTDVTPIQKVSFADPMQ